MPVPLLLRFSVTHRDLHSFPTRRSSDLAPGLCGAGKRELAHRGVGAQLAADSARISGDDVEHAFRDRSEEHTSELQSLAYLVCRLLLEKKNTTSARPTRTTSAATQPAVL